MVGLRELQIDIISHSTELLVHYTSWINIHLIIVLKNKPSQKDLDQISKKAGTNWRSLLTQLGEDSTTVEGFLLSPSSNTIEACFKGLVHWLEGNADEPVTWETLLKALRDADMKGYADDLEKELKGYARVEWYSCPPSPCKLDYEFSLCSALFT